MKNKETILVTGGAGYIGSHTCKAIHQAGFLPIAYDNLSRGHEWSVKWGPLEIGDIRDINRLNDVIDTYKPVAAMHFAALAYVGESVDDPGIYYNNNLSGTIILLESLRRNNIHSIIFSSSCATYGKPEKLPMTEAHVQNPINPYGNSKLMVEKILLDYQKAYGLHWASLRYFNAAGADPDLQTGEVHEPETHLIPNILNAASNSGEKVTIYGTDYDTPDGTCIRDYVHVSDLARGHVNALGNLMKNRNSFALNLGTGKGYSVREVIRAAEAITSKSIPVEYRERRPGDPAALVASAEKAEREIGWKPERSDMETIIDTAWRWHLHCRRDIRK